jgi:hypothetical protein
MLLEDYEASSTEESAGLELQAPFGVVVLLVF